MVVDDEPDIGSMVQEILEDEGYSVSVADSGDAARKERVAKKPDLILLDIWMPDIDGISLLREWSESGGLPSPVVMMSGHGTVETAVEATRLGAYDFIEKPISLAKLLLTVERGLQASRLEQENEGLKKQVSFPVEPVGHSEAMQNLREQVEKLSSHDAWILISGEAGTGKETLARYLHTRSPRSRSPFVTMNVGAMATENAAVELFGSEQEGDVHYGKLEQATGGILFIDEVADMEPETQLRLSSALENQSFLRIGGNEPVSVDVRVVAATCRNLEEEVKQGRFREELYYQLNVVPLNVPPLRDRRADIPDLLKFYAEFFPTRDGLPYRRFAVAAQNRLRNYDWPGNVRELKNLVQRLLILGKDEEISSDEVDQALGSGSGGPSTVPDAGAFNMPLREAREQFERNYLIHQLREVGGSVGKLSKRVGMERTHLYRKLRALGVDPKQV